MKKKLLVFHPVIAPYRIDFFNRLSEEFDARVCLSLHNLPDQTFDYDKILSQLSFTPVFLDQESGSFMTGIARQLKEFDPDIVLVPEVGMVTLLALAYRMTRGKQYKVISMVDDSYNMLVEGNQFSKKHALAEKMLFPFLDDMILVEPKVQEHIFNEYGKGIHFPIIQEEQRVARLLKDSAEEAERLVKEYGLQGCKTLLSVCRLVKLKNLETTIEAFKKTEDPAYRYVIVGSGPEEGRLKDLAKEDPRIIFTGRKEGTDLFAWYLVASSFILASVQEAFGAVTDEALLAGCWCLVSNKVGSACLIKDGVNGNLFNPMDVDGISALMDSSLKESTSPAAPYSQRSSRRLTTFNAAFESLKEKMVGSDKPRVLFIMHMPPPVHGAAMVGKSIHDSRLINDSFDCRYVNLTVAKNLNDIGKLSIRKVTDVFRLIKRARKVSRQFRPDIIYFTPNTKGMPFYKDFLVKQALRKQAKRIVLHFHNKGVSKRQDHLVDDFLYRRFFKGVDVILLDKRLYQDVRKYVSETAVHYCANGIEDKALSTEVREHGRVPRILFLSNMMKAKGVWTLLEACSILKGRNVEFTCNFVGGWKDIQKDAFESKVHELGIEGAVKASGPKFGDEKLEYLANSDIMAFPTLDECFGLVLLEAMQHKLACIATEEGGIPSIIKDGETGIIIQKNDYVALANAIEKLCKDPVLRVQMGEAGRRRFQELYTVKKFEQTFCRIIQDLT